MRVGDFFLVFALLASKEGAVAGPRREIICWLPFFGFRLEFSLARLPVSDNSISAVFPFSEIFTLRPDVVERKTSFCIDCVTRDFTRFESMSSSFRTGI